MADSETIRRSPFYDPPDTALDHSPNALRRQHGIDSPEDEDLGFGERAEADSARPVDKRAAPGVPPIQRPNRVGRDVRSKGDRRRVERDLDQDDKCSLDEDDDDMPSLDEILDREEDAGDVQENP